MPNKNKSTQNFKEKENTIGKNLLDQLIKRIVTLESLIDGRNNKIITSLKELVQHFNCFN
jgi:hypothetical protein